MAGDGVNKCSTMDVSNLLTKLKSAEIRHYNTPGGHVTANPASKPPQLPQQLGFVHNTASMRGSSNA